MWQPKGQQIPVTINAKRHKGHTVYGAVGSCLNGLVWMIGESTNTIEFRKFIRQLIRAKRRTPQKPVICLDRHVAHRNPETQRLMQRYFEVLMCPPASCLFNLPIERMWHIIRSSYRIDLHEEALRRELTKRMWLMLLRRKIRLVTPFTCDNLLSSNNDYIR